MIFCARFLRNVPSRFNSLYPRINCRRTRLNTHLRIVTCVLQILYPAISNIGTARCEGFGKFLLRFSSSIGSSLITPVVSLICNPRLFCIHLSSALTALRSPFTDADVSAKSSINVPHRMMYGMLFPRLDVPCVYKSRIAYDIAKLKSHASR